VDHQRLLAFRRDLRERAERVGEDVWHRRAGVV
jgi:hypothetical protein